MLVKRHKSAILEVIIEGAPSLTVLIPNYASENYMAVPE
jgi:hypothetical protein